MADTPRSQALGRALDDRYVDDDILGVHCRTHGHLVALGLSDHQKCSGWWQTGIVDDKPVGFRCTCECHDKTRGNA